MGLKFRLTRIMGFGIVGKGLLRKRICNLGFVEKGFRKRIWDCGIRDLGLWDSGFGIWDSVSHFLGFVILDFGL